MGDSSALEPNGNIRTQNNDWIVQQPLSVTPNAWGGLVDGAAHHTNHIS